MFTPMDYAEHAFAAREYEPQLSAALTRPGQQVLVHGPSGAGKTTLTIRTLARLGMPHMLTECRRTHEHFDRAEWDSVWVLEDVHKLPDPLQRQVVEVMRSCASGDRKGRVIALGTAPAIAGDEILGETLERIAVAPMTTGELDHLLVTGAQALNVDIPAWMREAIIAHAGGHPAICHQFALALCLEAGVYQRAAQRVTIPDGAFAPAKARTPKTLL